MREPTGHTCPPRPLSLSRSVLRMADESAEKERHKKAILVGVGVLSPLGDIMAFGPRGFDSCRYIEFGVFAGSDRPAAPLQQRVSVVSGSAQTGSSDYGAGRFGTRREGRDSDVLHPGTRNTRTALLRASRHLDIGTESPTS